MTLRDISNGPDWVLPAVTALFAVLSLVLLLGKGSWLIAGYNTASPEEKKRYDEKRLCRVSGGGMAVLTLLMAVIGAVTVGVVAAVLILSNTVCRRKP